MSIPQDIHHLNRALALRILAAALLLSALGGGAAYLLESRRIERSAAAIVEAAVRHFQAPAMRLLDGEKPDGGHRELDDMLLGSNLVGLRVHGKDGQPIYEAWGKLTEPTQALLRSLPQSDGANAAGRHEQLKIGADKLIHQQVRLVDRHDRPIGHLEGFYRIDAATLDEWRERIMGTVAMTIVAVLAMAAVLYPLMLKLLCHATSLTKQLMSSNLSLLSSLGSAVAKRDSDTDAHNYRVTLYSVALAETLDLPDGEIAHLIAGAFLHDVGKIGIPDAILLKPGRLSADEFEIMKTHALHGLDIVAGNEWMASAADVIRHHHEKFDGSGYPDGLAGDRIPRIARLFAVVDVFDALVSTRPYKAPMATGAALSILRRDAGRHFDPAMVDAFEPIAGGLHDELTAASDAVLRRRLQAAITNYF